MTEVPLREYIESRMADHGEMHLLERLTRDAKADVLAAENRALRAEVKSLHKRIARVEGLQSRLSGQTTVLAVVVPIVVSIAITWLAG